MEITENTIRYLCESSRLDISDEECKEYVDDLKDLVKLFSQLNEIEDAESIKLTTKKLNPETDLREDKDVKGLEIQDVVKNSPESCGGAIVVPAVVE